MVKQQKKTMAPLPRRGVDWTPKMTMNMSDLSRDDDFLNHLLVEKLGTGGVPLYVHKMDPTRRLPKTDPLDLMAIVQRVSTFSPCLQWNESRATLDMFTDAFYLLASRFMDFCSSLLPRDIRSRSLRAPSMSCSGAHPNLIKEACASDERYTIV